MTHQRTARAILLITIFLLAALALPCYGEVKQSGHVREYYIAAEQVEWDYAPSGLELMHGAELPIPGGCTALDKTRYVEYTDGTFSQRKPQPEWLGSWGQSFAPK